MPPSDSTMNRRAFLTGWWKRGSSKEPRRCEAPTPQTPDRAERRPAATVRKPAAYTMPPLRPPGAGEERAFLERCDACGECVRACPYDALVQGRGSDGRSAAPEFEMARAPCRLCPDRPCVSACPTGALDASRPTRIGRAHLKIMDCLATRLSACAVCVERCPVDGAITLVGGKPRIQAARCVGCGECLFRCPAPTKAIAIIALG